MPLPAMSPPRSRSRSQPRRIHHYISMSFTTPENVVPQLYEWVSIGFPFPVIVHHYFISTTHLPPSSSSWSSSETPGRLSNSSSSSAGSDPNPSDPILPEFDDYYGSEEYVSPSESLVVELSRRLHRLAGEGDADVDAIPRRDPWTTWFPSTPPLRSREAPRPESTTPMLLFSSPGVAPPVLIHTLEMYRSEMGAITEDDIDVAGDQLQQELLHEQTGPCPAQPRGISAGLRNDEAGFAQRIHEERRSPQGSCLCWACRAILQRYSRRRN